MRSGKKAIMIKTKFGEFDSVFDSNYPERGYTVTVPRLRGVVTFGDNFNDAKKMVKEAIELHCGSLLEKGLAEVRVITHHRNSELIGA